MSAAPTTIFDRMSGLARELGAINLGQGFPDLPEPRELLEAAQRALVEKSNQYPPMRGLPELRRAVCDYYGREQGLEVREEEVIVTSGATEALAATKTVVRLGESTGSVSPATRNTSMPAHHMASDGAAVLKMTRPGVPFNRVEIASVSSATVTVAASGP